MQPSKRSQRRLLLRRGKKSTTNTMCDRLEFDEFDEMGEPVYLVKALPSAFEMALGGLVLAKYVRDKQLNLMVLDDDVYQVERAFFEAFEDQLGEPRVSPDYMAFVKMHLYASGKDVAAIIQKYDNLDSERSQLAKAKWVSLLDFLKAGNTTKAEKLLLDMSATSTY